MPTTRYSQAHSQRRLRILLMVLSLFIAHSVSADDTPVPVTGQLTLTGSTALSNLVTLWAEAFQEEYPAVVISVADPGSAAGLESLVNGTASAVLTSTPLDKRQRQQFVDRFDYEPSSTPVALDGVAIFVNPDNPLRRISLVQLDATFSVTRRCGAKKPVHIWSDLGVTGDLALLPITIIGRTDDSGAYYLFRRKALCGGDFKANFKAMAGPGGIQAAISNDRAAIGFASSSLHDSGLRVVPLAHRGDMPAVSPTGEAIRSGYYPLTRTLSIAYNLPPGRKIDPALHAFLDFTRSARGQALVAKAGFVELPVHMLKNAN